MQSNGSILAQQPIHMTIQADQETEASENVELQVSSWHKGIVLSFYLNLLLLPMKRV